MRFMRYGDEAMATYAKGIAASTMPTMYESLAPAAKSITNMRKSSATELPKSGSSMHSSTSSAGEAQVRHEADGEVLHLLALLRQRVREVDHPRDLGDLGGLQRDAGHAQPALGAAHGGAQPGDQHQPPAG